MADRSPHATPKILIVDDEEGLLFLMTDALRREGYDVEGFDTGAQALEWLVLETPDLLVLDLKLGDLSAAKLVERLGEKGRQFPFIIVTGHGDERTAVEMMKQGALDYVMKDAGMLRLLPGIIVRALATIERDRQLAAAGAALRQRDERHQKIIHTARDGFARLKRGGQLIEVNAALCELLGCAPEELLGKNVFDAEGAPFDQEIRDRVEHLGPDGFTRCFTRLIRRDGGHAEVEVSMRADNGEIFAFVHDLSEQRRLEREVIEISEDERRRFGRELHDGLGQQLTALELMSHTLARELKAAKSPRAKSADEISQYTRRAITQTRRLAHSLAPVAMEAEGLMAALHGLATMSSATGIHCDFQCDAPVSVHNPTVATHLFRIAQEAVSNALKHAKARHLIVRLDECSDRVELSIADDGRGFPRTSRRPAGMGLQVMHYRARLIGGVLHVHSKSGKGVRITCSLPQLP